MATNVSVPASSLTQPAAQQAVEDALGAALADDVVESRHHDCSVLNIPSSATDPVEINIDNSTVGAALGSAVKKIHASATFGAPIEILIGATAGAAVRKFVMNLGEGPLVIECSIASGSKLWVRNLNAAAVTSGVLTLNLLG